MSVKCQICIKFDSSIIEINYFIHDIGLFGYDLRTILIVMMAVSLSVLVEVVSVPAGRHKNGAASADSSIPFEFLAPSETYTNSLMQKVISIK